MLSYNRKLSFSLLLSLAFTAAIAGQTRVPRSADTGGAQQAKSGGTLDTEGEALFKEDKGEASIAPLEREIASGDNTADKYNYLGLAYYQAGDYKRSIAAFEKGMKAQGDAKWALYYNAGNSAFADGNFASAEGYYSDAYRMNGEFHAALLNRANARLNQDKIVEARDDYALYLERCPDSAQAERIRALLELLDEEIRKHAILPEKLESAVAVLPVVVSESAETETVEGVYPAAPPSLPAASEAMEKEAAFLQSAAPAAAASEAIGTATAPAMLPPKAHPQSEAVEKEASFLPSKARNNTAEAEAMDDAAAPPLPKRKSEEKAEAAPSEAMESDAVILPKQKSAPPASEAMEKVTPPPESKKSKRKLEAIKEDAPPPAAKKVDDAPLIESKLQPLEAIPQ